MQRFSNGSPDAFSITKKESDSMEQRISAGTRLGFIGLGYLGSRIARRLINAGFPMIVYDRDSTKAAPFAQLGAEVADNTRVLAANADVLLSSLPNDAAVEDVYLKAGNVLRDARPGSRCIELSTVAPETAREVNRAARRFGITVLDVAVSGSTKAAEAGALTLFGGGEREFFEAAKPLFAAIASQWFYMGGSGSGVAMKLVVNTMLGLGMQGLAEALALGSRLNLERDLLYDTLARTAVVAPALTGKLANAKKHDYESQFPARLMHKDFGLILNAAGRLDVPMPATEAAAIVNAVESNSGREEDFSAVIRLMERQTGTGSELVPAGAD
jgi:3-hydroxyisobutyrate dehydrogenase